MQKIKKIIILLVLVLIMSSCSYFIINENSDNKDKKIKTISFFQLDTIINIKLSEPVNEEILKNCEKIVSDIHMKMSPELKDSEISKINRNAGKKAVKVSKYTFEVIEKSIKYSKMSNGKFDISIRPLITAWSIGNKDENIPSDEVLSKLIKKVDYQNIVIDKKNKTVFIKEEGCSIDLGGIAKGYSADLVAQYLKSEDINSGILDFGGNIFVLGEKTNGKPWKVGIRNPFKSEAKAFCTIDVIDKTIVSSGIYERFFKKDGETYHHIMNVDTGKPINNGLVSVSVIGNTSIDADALSTMFFTSGLENGLSKANEMSDISAIFVNKNKEVYISDNLKNNFNIIDDNFTLMN